MWSDEHPSTQIRRIFHKKNGRKIEIVQDTYSTIDQLKKKSHARWQGDLYEFAMYEHGTDVDWNCHYYEIDSTKANNIPYEFIEQVYGAIPDPVCECGSEKLKLGGHSHWCPKYNP